jgi:hypothetical protein
MMSSLINAVIASMASQMASGGMNVAQGMQMMQSFINDMMNAQGIYNGMPTMQVIGGGMSTGAMSTGGMSNGGIATFQGMGGGMSMMGRGHVRRYRRL